MGSFGDAMAHLKKYELDRAIREVVAEKKPFLGICLGLQLLFEASQETEGVEGLGILKGQCLRIPETEGLKIPHIGWNSLVFHPEGRLFSGIFRGGLCLFCSLLLSSGRRSFHRKSNLPVWCADPCIGGKGQCVCLSVPPGEEQPNGPADIKNFTEI